MMDYSFLTEATAELEQATEYYDRERPGLGREFLEEVGKAIA